MYSHLSKFLEGLCRIVTISSLNAVELTCEATYADTPGSGDDVHTENSADLQDLR